MLRALAVAAALALPSIARADVIMDPPPVPAKLSLVVEGEAPAGKAFIVANTWSGADVVRPGVEQGITWHPDDGRMELRLVDADLLPERPHARLSPEALRLRAAGVGCGGAFRGYHAFPPDSNLAAARLVVRVEATGAHCEAGLLRVEFRDAMGAVVTPPADLDSYRPGGLWGAPPSDSGPDLLSVDAPPRPADGPTKAMPTPRELNERGPQPAAIRANGCHCGAAPGASLAWLLLLGLRRPTRAA